MVMADRGKNSDRESVRVGPHSGLAPPPPGECNDCQDRAAEGKSQRDQQKIQGRQQGWRVTRCFEFGAKGDHAKPDQHGRRDGRFGHGAAGPVGGQALSNRALLESGTFKPNHLQIRFLRG
jgi:hypothetical protein